MRHVRYIGIDRSRQALDYARAKFPGVEFHELDVNSPDADLGRVDCDYLVANGLFTIRHVLSQEQMQNFLESTLARVWPHVRRGLAFNVMSKVVDWERDDLFHASMDDMMRVLNRLAGRRVRMRADYGLYEFTCYAFRGETQAAIPAATELPAPADSDRTIRVLRPALPTTDAILPYLRRIEASRIYSNFGPLVLEFEERLSRHLGLPRDGVVSANTGTAGLVAAILATAGRARAERNLALMPGFTFVATAVAAEECGYQPCLSDVSPETWLLDPEALLAHPDLDRIGVVIPVAAFGRPVAQAGWIAFQERTGIPVVIDGAASLEAVAESPGDFLGPIPVMLSLHATKSLATGEGGCVVGTDPELTTRIGQALNYGFHFSRDSRTPSINGKMSEYHAAVGLAELDGWPRKQAAFAKVVASYRRQFEAAGLMDRLLVAPFVCSSYVLFLCADPAQALRVQDSLQRDDIEFRRWYGDGLHHQTHFANSPRARLVRHRCLGALRDRPADGA